MTTCPAGYLQRRRFSRKGGSSLVDVMMAAVVLSTLAIAVGALTVHGRAGLALQRHRQVALGLAHTRLEEVRASSFASIRPAASNLVPVYLARSGAGWTLSPADPGETVQENGRTFALQTLVQWTDADGGGLSYDALRIRVSVGFRAGSGDEVVLETWRAPGGSPP